MVIVWYSWGDELGQAIGFNFATGPEKALMGFEYFISQKFLWFDVFFIFSSLLLYAFWKFISPQKWSAWSVLGSCGITFLSYFYVQFAVAYNNWLGPYFDLIQKSLTTEKKVSLAELYSLLFTGIEIFVIGCFVFVVNRFLISHFIFRWRTAMSDYYIEHWKKVRHIEGASQRVQEDTMKFASIMESLGVQLIESVMTLIAFIPLLVALSAHVTELPLVGKIPYPLCVAAFSWAAFGTLSLGLLGIKLPGLEFENQKVEAAYRKELVYGEDDDKRA